MICGNQKYDEQFMSIRLYSTCIIFMNSNSFIPKLPVRKGGVSTADAVRIVAKSSRFRLVLWVWVGAACGSVVPLPWGSDSSLRASCSWSEGKATKPEWRNCTATRKRRHNSSVVMRILRILGLDSLTGLRLMTELLDITVPSPSMSGSLWSSPASGMLLTELLWELALMDMLGMDWLLPTLFTVPVPLTLGSGSYTHTAQETIKRLQQ